MADLAPGTFAEAARPFEPEPDASSAKPERAPKAEAPADPSGQSAGWWIESTDGALVVRHALELYRYASRKRKKRRVEETRWRMLRSGARGLNVVRGDNYNDYEVRESFGSTNLSLADNKPDQLIRRTGSLLTQDMPAPVCRATKRSATARDAKEVAERMLRAQGQPSKLDDVGFWFGQIDESGTVGTVFSHTFNHPRGGGLVPMSIRAHPTATTVADAATKPGPTPAGPMPMGAPPPEALPRVSASREELVRRFVKLDGSLTDRQGEARLIWQNEIMRRRVFPAQVVLLPFAADARTATGALIGEFITVGEYVARFCDGKRPQEPELKRCVDWKPEGVNLEDWLTLEQRELWKTAGVVKRHVGAAEPVIADETLVPILSLYLVSQESAPLGAHLVVCGADEPIVREVWSAVVGEGPDAVREMSPLPLVAMKWRSDINGDPLGVPGIEDLANAAAIRTTMLELILNDAWEKGNRHTFLPTDSTFQEDEYMSRTQTVWRLLPEQQPFFEQQPALDAHVTELYTGMADTLEEIVGLNSAVATGQTPTDVKSGKQLQLVQEETRAGLANLHDNFRGAIQQDWLVRLVLSRRFYDTQREMEYAGVGGAMRQLHFEGADLLGVVDVEIAKGSGTLLSQTAKANVARTDLQTAITVGDQEAIRKYQDVIAGQSDSMMGVDDSPAKIRVDEQIAAWAEGAKRGNYPPPPPPIPAPAPPMAEGAPMEGGAPPMPGPGMQAPGAPVMVPAPDPIAEQANAIFDLNPADDIPANAKIRFYALNDAMNGETWRSADARYKNALTAAFMHAKMCIGVQTVPEQQQAMAEQQRAQAEAEETQRRTEAEGKRSETEAGRAHELEKAEQANAHKLQQGAASAAQKSALQPQVM